MCTVSIYGKTCTVKRVKTCTVHVQHTYVHTATIHGAPCTVITHVNTGV